MNEVSSNLEKARQKLWLRQKQALLMYNRLPPDETRNNTLLAISNLLKTRAYTVSPDKKFAIRGPFRYDLAIEKERIDVATQIILRSQPGPYEDANYFSLLAYQAASIELVLKNYNNKLFENIILGTLHHPVINAFASINKEFNTTTVTLHSAIIDFVFQAAKSVVQFTNPVKSENKNTSVNIYLNKINEEENSENRQAAINRLYDTLESCFFYGYPRAHVNEKVIKEHYPSLHILVSMAERWMIAHEYGHGFVKDDLNRFKKSGMNSRHAEEYFSDANATVLTVLSAYNFDHLPPEFALSGGSFVLACLEVIQRAFSFLSTGIETKDQSSRSHPSNINRLKQNIITFRQLFDVEYDDQRRSCKLDFVTRSEVPKTHNFDTARFNNSNLYSNILLQIWEKIKVLLSKDIEKKRPLHPMWL